jgi:hypothetical protein
MENRAAQPVPRQALLADVAKRFQRITASTGLARQEVVMVHLGCVVRFALDEARGDFTRAERLLRQAFETTLASFGGDGSAQPKKDAQCDTPS